jgi:hypothetical protein
MLRRVEILKTESPEEYYLAFPRDVKPEVGDTTIGLNSVCKVVHIIDKVGTSEFILSDGSALVNPVKIICPLSDIQIDCEEPGSYQLDPDGFIHILAK